MYIWVSKYLGNKILNFYIFSNNRFRSSVNLMYNTYITFFWMFMQRQYTAMLFITCSLPLLSIGKTAHRILHKSIVKRNKLGGLKIPCNSISSHWQHSYRKLVSFSRARVCVRVCMCVWHVEVSSMKPVLQIFDWYARVQRCRVRN